MSDTFTLDVDEAAEFKYACERNGLTNADVKKLSSGTLLRELLPVIRGQAEVKQVTHMIDLDAPPLIPYDGWQVEEHKKGGQFIWDPTKLRFHLSENQRNGLRIEGNKLRKELAQMPTSNANVLDYLLDHPHLIPEEWKLDEQGRTRYIYFWATIYRDSDGSLCVRSLCFRGGRWQTGYDCLDLDWRAQGPAVVRAESDLGA